MRPRLPRLAPSGRGRSGGRCPFTGQKRKFRFNGPRSVDDPGCVKTCTSRECAELFSLFSSFDGDCQSGSFLTQPNRDRLSTRKPDVGVFTQSGPKGEVAGYSMTSSASASIVGGMSRPRALAVASGDKDVAFSNSSCKCDPSQSHRRLAWDIPLKNI